MRDPNSQSDSPRPRLGRGWGPFSGGQLTMIIVTFAVLLLFPIGAWAVSGSNVFVTDATSGSHASVNSGALTVATASPKNFFVRGGSPGNGTFTRLLKPPPGKAAIVTSIVFDVYNAAATGGGHNIAAAVSRTDTSCGSIVLDPATFFPAFDFNPPGIGDTVIPFQPGLVIPANRALCVANFDTANLSVEVYAYGYYVAASAAPAGAAAVPHAGAIPQQIKK
jgi:hypothetical protein